MSEQQAGREWKVGDWVVFDLNIAQITKLEPYQEVSDGSASTSGRLSDRFRPLTLTNKSIMEYFGYYYRELRKIRGEHGFNYPAISRYFCELSLESIDCGDDHEAQRKIHEKAPAFLRMAQEYTPIIDNVHLFRQS